ncbi:hypothetical protein BGZ94_006629, partial [Podila epigama]
MTLLKFYLAGSKSLEAEDDDHIWKCPSTSVVQQDMWDKAIVLLDTWGPLSVAQANKNTDKLRARAEERGKVLPPAPPPIQWRRITATKIWD